MVLTADSSSASETPAWCCVPTFVDGSTVSSRCRPLRRSSTAAARSPSPGPVAGELRRVGEAGAARRRLGDQLARRGHEVGGDVGVAALGQREVLVEQPVGLGDDLRAAALVVAGRQLVLERQRVGAVQRVEQRAPPGVGGVERVARHGRRDDELRPGHLGDLAVDPRHADRGLLERQQVADLGEEGLQRVDVAGAVLAVPGVDLLLQLVAPLQQLLDPPAEALLQVGGDRPEPLGLQVEAGEQLTRHEVGQRRLDLQATGARSRRSWSPLSLVCRPATVAPVRAVPARAHVRLPVGHLWDHCPRAGAQPPRR